MFSQKYVISECGTESLSDPQPPVNYHCGCKEQHIKGWEVFFSFSHSEEVIQQLPESEILSYLFKTKLKRYDFWRSDHSGKTEVVK